MGESAAIYTLFSHFSGFHCWHHHILDFAILCRWSQIGILPTATDCQPSLCTVPLRFHYVCSNPPKSSSRLHTHIPQILIRAQVVSLRIEWLFVRPIGICPFVPSLGRSPWQTAGAASSTSAISILKPFTSLWLSIAINSITATLLMRRHNLAPVYSSIHVRMV